MTDFLKIAKSIVVHFAHIICANGIEMVNSVLNFAQNCSSKQDIFTNFVFFMNIRM